MAGGVIRAALRRCTSIAMILGFLDSVKSSVSQKIVRTGTCDTYEHCL
jgi:hypothetical protein